MLSDSRVIAGNYPSRGTVLVHRWEIHLKRETEVGPAGPLLLASVTEAICEGMMLLHPILDGTRTLISAELWILVAFRICECRPGPHQQGLALLRLVNMHLVFLVGNGAGFCCA